MRVIAAAPNSTAASRLRPGSPVVRTRAEEARDTEAAATAPRAAGVTPSRKARTRGRDRRVARIGEARIINPKEGKKAATVAAIAPRSPATL
ncbi:MAG: hypothetical protein Fur0042_16930 [Cyanophyceae cyanobacterium]